MAIELNDDLLALQRAADEAHAQLKALSEEYGRPTQEVGWTEEQHAAWDEALEVWRQRGAEAQQAVTDHAAATSQDRGKLEAEVKKAVRHPEPTEG
ncbi:hypothetical protein [Streptomyces sp. NBC_01264]|uniref:hypothetical protein n=1 Tax=Streptomyces sp. NBC_01264 TaxID=2903804 RepID=UPI0022596D2B|nr:hypothetical protein [Streptomyces sp. NBC_01264]MCX4778191.1 hypothetical protein [Streptomyces sp. NBC_01264]